MKIMGRRRNEDGNSQKIQVNILGRGTESISSPEDATIGNLRESLDLGSNVKAVDGAGNELRNSDRVKNSKEVNFVPNVQGG